MGIVERRVARRARLRSPVLESRLGDSDRRGDRGRDQQFRFVKGPSKEEIPCRSRRRSLLHFYLRHSLARAGCDWIPRNCSSVFTFASARSLLVVRRGSPSSLLSKSKPALLASSGRVQKPRTL